MKNHCYYTPSDYEQMLIAAGWVTLESLDVDYQDYARRDDDPLSYERWQDVKREWDALNAEYERDIEPLIQCGSKLPFFEQQKADRMIQSMSHLEYLLGY